MNGRLENKLKTEQHIKEVLSDAPEYIKKFDLSMKSKSHTTKKNYVLNTKRFLLWYGNGKYPSVDQLKLCDAFTVQEYVSKISFYKKDGEIKELKETSQCTIYSAIRAFFEFLKRNKYIEESPYDNKAVERPRTQENDVVFLTPEEVRLVQATILDGVGNNISKAKQKDWVYRDLLLFRIPVINGLRVTALSEINVDDVDFINSRIKVTEKRNIHKYVSFDFETARYLRLWMKQRRYLLNGAEVDALFISNRRTRLTVRSIEMIIGKYTEACIENKHITPHKLRATCGTNTYRETHDIYMVADILGHASTSTTSRYTDIDQKDKIDVINKVAKLY